MKAFRRYRRGKMQSEFMRRAEAEAAEIAAIANGGHRVVAEGARGGEALFDQRATDAELSLRRVHRDWPEQEP